jgi:phosphoribosyl-AMP cyclohydrolase
MAQTVAHVTSAAQGWLIDDTIIKCMNKRINTVVYMNIKANANTIRAMATIFFSHRE